MKQALKDLESVFPIEQILTDSESCKYYGKDWTTYFDIHASAILFPKTTLEVQTIVKWAIQHHIALVPSGGRTGLSGGACATQGEVVVSFEKMNQIIEFNEVESSVTCQAGLVTEALQQFAQTKQLYYPVDFAARGSSMIGGNIATNAGGIKVVKWGLTRDWVAGLKVVTGSGDILEFNKSLVKNATGLDFRHLFIGSEGILGFITECTIKLIPPPKDLKVLVMAIADLSSVMKIFSLFNKKTELVAYEMFSQKAVNHVMKHNNLPPPTGIQSDYYVIAEIEVISDSSEENLLSVFEEGTEKGWILDGTISQSDMQAKSLWRYREGISESIAPHSPYKNDVSVAISKVPEFIQNLDQVLNCNYPHWEVVWFGHIGDGNLHINILKPQGLAKEEFVSECRKVDEIIFKSIQNLQGSISAEHGVGLTKKSFLSYSRNPVEIEAMKQIKKIFDPHNIINPGKLI